MDNPSRKIAVYGDNLRQITTGINNTHIIKHAPITRKDHVELLNTRKFSRPQVMLVATRTTVRRIPISLRLTSSTFPFSCGKEFSASPPLFTLGLITSVLQRGHCLTELSSSTPQLTQYDILVTLPVTFYFDMNTILNQLGKEIPLYISFNNTTGKINRQYIIKTYYGTISSS